jgi:hypothetical protein
MQLNDHAIYYYYTQTDTYIYKTIGVYKLSSVCVCVVFCVCEREKNRAVLGVAIKLSRSTDDYLVHLFSLSLFLSPLCINIGGRL